MSIANFLSASALGISPKRGALYACVMEPAGKT